MSNNPPTAPYVQSSYYDALAREIIEESAHQDEAALRMARVMPRHVTYHHSVWHEFYQLPV